MSIKEFSRTFHSAISSGEAIVVCDSTRRREAHTALADVTRLFRLADATLNWHRSDSEVAAPNASAGRRFCASSLLLRVVSEALDAARSTGGLYDPIVRVCAAAGREKDSGLRVRTEDWAGDPSPPSRSGGWRDVELDAATRTILLPTAGRLDLDGIGKGWALDQAANSLRHFENFAIEAGGDVTVGGHQAGGSLWTVGVEDPLGLERDLLELRLTDRAIATASTARSRWRSEEERSPGIVDPRNGRAAHSGAMSATVIAGSAARAEALARAALLLGPAAGIHFLDGIEDVEGMVVLDGGYIQRSGGFERIERAA